MGTNIAKVAGLGHRCDLSNLLLINYSHTVPSATEELILHTNGVVRPRSATKPALNSKMDATKLMDILVIEDDAIMREVLAEWLEAAGYGVRKAADGRAGLAAVKLAAPALAITDIYMPGTSGAVVITQLKQTYPKMPIIAISGLFNSRHGMDADAAIALGAARALAKPFKRSDLLRAVADLLGAPTP
jgi:CheY-like chemotaxis protein